MSPQNTNLRTPMLSKWELTCLYFEGTIIFICMGGLIVVSVIIRLLDCKVEKERNMERTRSSLLSLLSYLILCTLLAFLFLFYSSLSVSLSLFIVY
jgi:uncharacterized membrane protein YidH (DUF202 family)